MSQSMTYTSKDNPNLIIEVESQELEDELRRMLIYARKQSGLTQQQLAEKSGIRQSNISRIESGSCVPSLQSLKQLATAMDKKIRIEFI